MGKEGTESGQAALRFAYGDGVIVNLSRLFVMTRAENGECALHFDDGTRITIPSEQGKEIETAMRLS